MAVYRCNGNNVYTMVVTVLVHEVESCALCQITAEKFFVVSAREREKETNGIVSRKVVIITTTASTPRGGGE